MSAARAVADRIASRLGLLPHARWIGALERAEPDLVRRHGKSLGALLDRVDVDPQLFLELAGLLSVGETFFFRHAPHFDLLLEHVSRRAAALGPGEKVNVWSAGCSSGEEPYSVAMVIHARLGASALGRVQVLATDVDPRAIARAERGHYTPWSFRAAPAWIEAYFRPGPNGARVLAPGPIRDAVTFEAGALEPRAMEFAAGSIDAILFRNVAIYLTDDARERLHAAMHTALRTDGLLIQGPSDPTPSVSLFARIQEDPTFSCHRRSDPRELREGTSQAAPARYARRSVSALRKPRTGAGTRGRRVRETRADTPSTRAPAISGLGPMLDRALELAERGALDRALEAASPLLAIAAPADAAVMRGKLWLAARRFDEAVEHFRRAVYLAGDASPMTRYWYASALHVARNDHGAAKQLRELARQLRALPAEAVIDDGDTRAAQLLESVQLMLETYE